MHRRRSSLRHRRAGLAPLEFVLALPLLLVMATVMINIGDYFRWLTRTQINSRNETWQTLSHRTGDLNPMPQGWRTPPQATLAHLPGALLRSTPPLSSSSEPVTAEMIQGFDTSAGTHWGSAEIDIRIRLLANRQNAGQTGEFELARDNNLLDRLWTYWDLGYISNDDRRSRLLQSMMTEVFSQNLQSGLIAYQNQMYALSDLYVLDRDEVFLQYGTPPQYHDFHPSLRWCGNPAISACADSCTTDVALVQLGPQADLLRDIRELPGTMAQEYIELYENYLGNPNLPTAERVRIAAEIDRLRQFYNRLPPQNRPEG